MHGTHHQQLRLCLSGVINVSLDDEQWCQASLPVKDGGLGIRSTLQLAPSAFLASASGTRPLVSVLLQNTMPSPLDPSWDHALTVWNSMGGNTVPAGTASSSQKLWDRPVIDKSKACLISTAVDDVANARLRAAWAPHSGDWLNAPPLSAVGLRMDNETLRIATGLRLGTPLCAPHICPCKAPVDARGIHGLSCRQSASRSQRHAQINDIIHRALIRAGVQAVRKPSGTLVGSGLRPHGATLIPWTRGKCLAWDATCADTLAESHLPSTRSQAGAAAEHLAMTKTQKYSSFSPTYHFVPVAVETLGSWNMDGLQFIKDLGRRTTAITNDPRETAFLLQRLSVAVQRGNATSVKGSLPVKKTE